MVSEQSEGPVRVESASSPFLEADIRVAFLLLHSLARRGWRPRLGADGGDGDRPPEWMFISPRTTLLALVYPDSAIDDINRTE
jgi:hypothetical protein